MLVIGVYAEVLSFYYLSVLLGCVVAVRYGVSSFVTAIYAFPVILPHFHARLELDWWILVETIS